MLRDLHKAFVELLLVQQLVPCVDHLDQDQSAHLVQAWLHQDKLHELTLTVWPEELRIYIFWQEACPHVLQRMLDPWTSSSKRSLLLQTLYCRRHKTWSEAFAGLARKHCPRSAGAHGIDHSGPRSNKIPCRHQWKTLDWTCAKISKKLGVSD